MYKGVVQTDKTDNMSIQVSFTYITIYYVHIKYYGAVLRMYETGRIELKRQ